jgi:hypothetical protein
MTLYYLIVGSAILIIGLVIFPYVFMVWRLYRSFPALRARLGPKPQVLAPPGEDAGYVEISLSMGTMQVPAHITDRQVIFDAARHPDVGFMLSLGKGGATRTVISVSSLDRVQPISFLRILSWWKFDFYRSVQWALSARFWLPALIFKAFLLGRSADVSIARIVTPHLTGFMRKGRRPAGDFLEYHLFNDSRYFTASFIGYTGILTEEEIMQIAASFTPVSPERNLSVPACR